MQELMDSPFLKVQKAEIIEITMKAATFEYKIGYQENLLNNNIVGIVVSSNGYKATTNADICDSGDGYLYLQANDSNETILELPCRNLLFTPGVPALQVMEFGGGAINWEKSKLQFSPGATIVADQVFQMTVYYHE